MARKRTDQEIVDNLTKRLGSSPQSIKFDKEGRLIELSFYGFVLAQLPSEIYQLSSLRVLDISCNQLTSLPPEIGQLAHLQKLHLNHNQLTSLPPEIGQLAYLQKLHLNHNQLTSLPPEIGQLANLQWLTIGNTGISFMPDEIRYQPNWQEYTSYRNQLTSLPLEVWKLTNLKELDLWGNQLTSLPQEIKQLNNLTTLYLGKNQLTSLPPEIGQLINLQVLLFHNQPISYLPPEIGLLTNLQHLTLTLDIEDTSSLPQELWHLPKLRYLRLDVDKLSLLPPEIGLLTNLQELMLSGRHLSSLPYTLWKLSHLQRFCLYNSQLSELPHEIGTLTNLRELDLWRNRLSQLPREIGELTNLRRLDLRYNRLRQLPSQIGALASLEELRLDGNPHLLTPPPEIVERGIADILTFLQELQKSSTLRHEAKLLIVGEGGTGKTSLLRALRNEEFDPNLSTTHGIEVSKLNLASSTTKITLNTWDFGGQHIYHATHQFFLTRRSLYLVVWNARLGVEQGRLHYWLETIKALAPDAPVILVATHVDERAPDLNYQLLKATYSQLVGNLSVSNRTGAGLAEIKAELINQAAKLPLTGQPWPQKWLDVEHNLMSRPEHHIDAATYVNCCSSNGVDETIAKGTLGAYLHDLGKILYFRDDYVLCNLVVLKPNWITKAISLILTDEAVSKANGILQHSELPRIWAVDEEGYPYGSHLYPIFLRLMERFDLSYQIESDVPGEHATRSLVPQLLPYQPPINLLPWPKMPPEGQTQVEMVYRFDFVPAGIMSSFIVHAHRYTTNLHWREGVLLEYQGHEARVELNPMARELRLLVWGVQPHNFFTILMNTLDIILLRFQGLVVRREIPCICHWDRPGAQPCTHFYSYEELVRRMEARRYRVECAQTFAEVSVPMLLYGIHTSTDEQVMTDIQLGQQRIEKRLDDLQKLDIILEKLHQQSELIVRNFTRHWNLEMQKMEAECPNTFILAFGSSSHFNPKNWISQEYILHLVCQHPPGPHSVGDGYKLREAEEWWKKVSPWLSHLIKFLKFGVPMGRAFGAIYDEVDVEHMKVQIDLMEEITKCLPEITTSDTLSNAATEPDLNHEQQVIGPALRALHSFLAQADPDHVWGGLHKTLTPDGNILWLCATHRKQYEVRPLKLED